MQFQVLLLLVVASPSTAFTGGTGIVGCVRVCVHGLVCACVCVRGGEGYWRVCLYLCGCVCVCAESPPAPMNHVKMFKGWPP